MTDKYTLEQVFSFLEGYVQKPDENLPSLLEFEIMEWGKKIGDKISKKIEGKIGSGLKGAEDLIKLVLKKFNKKKNDKEGQQNAGS